MEANILKVSNDGKLRLRKMRGNRGVVELDCGYQWVWCVWRSLPLDRAKELFENQSKFH